MEKWNAKKYNQLLLTDKRKALKYVAKFNTKLIKNEEFNIPQTITITMDKFIKDISSQLNEIKTYSKTQLVFVGEQTDVAAYYIAQKKYNVAILNFADPNEPGGLYKNGIETQEEELCRTIPALYPSLSKTKAYPFDCYKTIHYTPNLQLVRDAKNSYREYESEIFVNVITAAAPNLSHQKFDKKKTYDVMEMLFFAPKLYDDNQVDALVLGAWGCGAFGNDPHTIANLFSKLILQYKNYYRVICIAIPKNNTNNYDIFHKVINKKLTKSKKI